MHASHSVMHTLSSVCYDYEQIIVRPVWGPLFHRELLTKCAQLRNTHVHCKYLKKTTQIMSYMLNNNIDKTDIVFNFNPFTALACNISGLKVHGHHAVCFLALCHIYFQCYAF